MIEGAANAFRNDFPGGRAASVAGGTSGINLAIARRFAAVGASVAVLGRNRDKATATAARIGGGALAVVLDVVGGYSIGDASRQPLPGTPE